MTPGIRSFDLFNHEYDYKPNWTARSSVILPISHNYNKICDILCFPRSESKNPFKCACMMANNVQLLCPIGAEIRTVDSQSDLRILL